MLANISTNTLEVKAIRLALIVFSWPIPAHWFEREAGAYVAIGMSGDEVGGKIVSNVSRMLLRGVPVTLQVILADNQVIFRTGIARVLALEKDIHIVAQCGDAERLKEAVGSLRKSIVIFPSSIAADLRSLLEWIEQADSRSVVILEHDATLDPAIARRIEGLVLRSVRSAAN